MSDDTKQLTRATGGGELIVNDTTAEKINANHALIKSNAGTMVQLAVEIGQLLIAKRKELEHGQFKKWIEENCDFSYETAHNYTKVARQKCSALQFSSIRAVLAYSYDTERREQKSEKKDEPKKSKPKPHPAKADPNLELEKLAPEHRKLVEKFIDIKSVVVMETFNKEVAAAVEKAVAERTKKLDDRESKLTTRAQELDKRKAALDKREEQLKAREKKAGAKVKVKNKRSEKM
jgi:hypothetical protein